MTVHSLEGGQLHIKEKVIIDLIHFALQKHRPYIKPYNEWKKRVKSSLIRNEKNGISVMVEQNEIQMNVCLSIRYGVDMRYITKMLQKELKEEIEHCTGFHVNHVGIRVEDIHFDE